MSFSNPDEWRLIDEDGNELEITKIELIDAANIEVVEYEPNTSALTVFKRAIEVEFLDDIGPVGA